MQRTHNEEPQPAFIHTGEAWYGKSQRETSNELDSVHFGMMYQDGSTTGMVSMCWYTLRGDAWPQLEAFQGAWAVFMQFQEVIADLAPLDPNRTPMTPAQFCDLLKRHGFTDRTEYKMTPQGWRP